MWTYYLSYSFNLYTKNLTCRAKLLVKKIIDNKGPASRIANTWRPSCGGEEVGRPGE
jgi:hypothetical protein